MKIIIYVHIYIYIHLVIYIYIIYIYMILKQNAANHPHGPHGPLLHFARLGSCQVGASVPAEPLGVTLILYLWLIIKKWLIMFIHH